MSIKKRAVAPYSIKSGSLLQPLRSFQGRYSIKIGYKSNKTIQICTLFFCHQHVTRSHSRICFRQISQIIRQIALSSADDSRPLLHQQQSANLPYLFRLLCHHRPERKPPLSPSSASGQTLWIMAVSPAEHPAANRQPDSHIIIPCIWRYGKMDLPKIASDC